MESLSIESSQEFEPIDIGDPEEAREFIKRRMEEEHELPVITVPMEHLEAARQGIKPRTTWIYDAIIAGTLGRKPYEMEGSDRVAFAIHVSSDQVEPRFTGPDKHFHGIVVFKGPITPELLEEMN